MSTTMAVRLKRIEDKLEAMSPALDRAEQMRIKRVARLERMACGESEPIRELTDADFADDRAIQLRDRRQHRLAQHFGSMEAPRCP